jgi:predicted dehydrogenase
MYIDAICARYREYCDLVALCDTSMIRIAYHNQRLVSLHEHVEVPSYSAGDFNRMLQERSPDVVIVTTMDVFHHLYIVAAMEHGCDVITEKPMTIDAERVGAILSAIDRTERHLTVTFNYRYAPAFTRLRQLVAEGAIGTPHLVDFSWMLDTSHGADYFRRWHREKLSSGGLLVHKASHHFDLVNWWIDSWPETVFAMGSLAFYGSEAAGGRGETYEYSRYTSNTTTDPFALDLGRSAMLRGLYLDAEPETGYLRDRNVFGDDISIEDTMVLSARYRSGVLLSYSLVAYSPWEGLRIAITGDRGRVELFEQQGAHIIEETPTGVVASKSPGSWPVSELRLFPMFQQPIEIEIPAGEGPHGGGDSLMLAQLFSRDSPPDHWGWEASHLDGAAAVLLGAAANQSIGSGAQVRLADLGIGLPPKPVSPNRRVEQSQA